MYILRKRYIVQYAILFWIQSLPTDLWAAGSAITEIILLMIFAGSVAGKVELSKACEDGWVGGGGGQV